MIDLSSPISLRSAFAFPLQSRLARREVLLGAALLLIPVVGWLLNMGHRIMMVHRMRHGQQAWPAWGDYPQLLRHGLITFAGMLYYYSPGLLVLGGAWVAGSASLAAFGIVLLVLATLAIPGYMTHYCRAFDRREIFNPVRALGRALHGGPAYWKAWITALCALLLSFVGLLAFGVGFLVTSVWFWQVAGFSFARVFSQDEARPARPDPGRKAMRDDTLRLFFRGNATGPELARALAGTVSREQLDAGPLVSRYRIEDMAEDFTVRPEHLVQLLDAVAAGALSLADLDTVCFCLEASDHFGWDTETPEGKRVAEALFWLGDQLSIHATGSGEGAPLPPHRREHAHVRGYPRPPEPGLRARAWAARVRRAFVAWRQPPASAWQRMRRIMYIECKRDGLEGPGRIGWVELSRSRRSYRYAGKRYRKTKSGFKHNCIEVESGDAYWISGPRRDGADRLYGGLVEIDDDARVEYWTTIRRSPERAEQRTYRC